MSHKPANTTLLLCLSLSMGTACLRAASEAESTVFQVDTSVHILDTVGDKMPNAWEIANGLNPSVNDAAANPDGDYLNNLAEYNAGTNPQVADYALARSAESGVFTLALRSVAPDQDGDGMPDAWELANGLNPAVNDASIDSDLDGRNNLAEYNAGTNPKVADILATLFAQSASFTANTGAYPAGFTADSDGDGMPDWWEARYGLEIGANDGGLDPDHDGLTNVQEYRTGSNPTTPGEGGQGLNYSPLFVGDFVGRLPDTDNDGIPDVWESAFGTNPLVADAAADPDLDGRNNLAEYNAGTNPLVDDWKGPSSVASLNFLTDTGGLNGGYSPDTDHDGMPDWWEDKYGLNRLVADGSGNLDNDALTNLQEYNAGSDPSRFGYLILVDATGNIFTCDTGGAFTDTDSDGIPDWWEKFQTGNRTAMSASADSDGDGKTNLAEYLAGLNPLDANSRFEIISTEAASDAQGPFLRVRWNTVVGRRYKVYSTNNLAAGWPTIPDLTVLGNGAAQASSIRFSGRLKLFVRVEVEVVRP